MNQQYTQYAKSFGTFTMPFIMLLLAMICVCNASVAHANKVYLSPKIYNVIWSDASISVYFNADETLCRKAYGDDWKQKCNVWLGKADTAPQGLETQGWPQGEWIWQNSTTLRFTPSEPWTEGTTYGLDLSQLSLPARVQLNNTKPSFYTIPLSAQMGQAKVWVDPSPKAEHGISFAMRFSAPIDENTRLFLQENAWPKTQGNSGLRLTPGKWVWLDDNTRAVVNARILTLPKEKSTVSITLPAIRPLWQEGNSWHFPKRDAVKDVVVPGTASLFTLEKAQLETWQNKALQMEQHLVFRFSQRVEAQDFLKALTVLELPLHRSEENVRPSNWQEGKIDPEARQKARALQPEWVRLPDESNDVLRFRVNASAGKYIVWNVAAGFGPTNDQGVKTPLAHGLEGVEFVPLGKPRLQLLQAGTVLMQQSDIAMVSEHLDSIRWSAHRFMDNALALPFLYSLDETLSPEQRNATAEVTRGEIAVSSGGGKAQGYGSAPVFSTLETKNIFGFHEKSQSIMPGLVYLHLEGVKDGRVITTSGRMLMHSSMALVLKELPNEILEAYVCDLDTAKPLSNVNVQVIGYNGIPVAEVKTDATGKAVLPNLSALQQEKRPVAVVARRMTDNKWNFMGLNEPQTEDMLWLSLQDYQRYVNLSNFAHINGKQSSTNTLNAFVFAQRGLFRPGEDLHFGALLRANDWKLLPANMPLVASIQDEVGRVVFEQEFKAQENIHSFTWNIPSNAMTGRYGLRITTPDSPQDQSYGLVLGSSSVRVENFLPDTLRLTTSLVQAQDAEKKALSTKGWIVTSHAASQGAAQVALQVQLDTLFGQVAAGRRVTSVMHLRPAYLQFDGYEEYTFQDVSPYFTKGTDPITRPLKSTLTDAKGQASIPLDFSQWRFGTLQCSINTEGYEAGGGRAVNYEKRFLLSPMPFMLGFKTGEGADNKNFILKDSAAKLQFQAIDSQLQNVNPGALIFSIARRHTVQSLVSDALGQYTYAETPVSTEIAQSQQMLSEQGNLTWNIPTQEVGEYILTVKMAPTAEQNAQNGATVLAQVSYSIVGNDDLRPALEQARHLPKAHLHIKTDKEYYNGGEQAQIMVTAPYDGVALISLERDSVAAHAWVKLPVGSSLHTLNIPKDFSGRAYVQVLMGRAAQSENIFLQPQSVAVASIMVNTKQKELPLQISAEKKALPGKALSWRIENTQGKPIKAVLFAVDEGILQLSRYNTPNPLYHLLLDRALEVRTAQLFDRFMPESSKIMQRLSAFGGDGDEGNSFRALLGSFQNPFKRKHEPPMTWWSGVVEIPAAGLDVEVPVPDYFNGTVRLMAVAHNEQGVGHGEARVIVQDTQVLIPQTPTTVSLGDSFEGGLNIANTTDLPMTLRTSLSLDAAQSTTEDMTLSHFAESVTLAPGEEKYLTFQGKVGNTPGVAMLRFSTEDSHGVRRQRTYPMSVRPAVLPRHSQHSFILNQSTQVHTRRQLLAYDAQSSLTLSPIPLPLLQSSLQYLHNYPYDCVEQSISKAFPLALLKNAPLGDILSKSLVFLKGKGQEDTFEDAQNTLVSAFRPMRGVSLWTHWTEISTLLTAYAADYVLTLQDAGLAVPPGMMPQIFTALERRINESPSSVEDLRALAYASWVLARAGYVVSKQLELCENYIRRQELTGSDVYNSLMAGAYEALYMRSDAQRHLNKVLGEAPKQWKHGSEMFDTLAQHGLHAQVLAKHFPQEFQKNMGFLQESLLEGLNKSHATMGASMAALGLIHMVNAQAETTADLQGVELVCGMYEQDMPDTEPTAQLFRQFYTLDAPGCTRFDVRIPAGQKYFAHMGAYGFDTRMPTKALEQGLVVKQSLTLEDETPFTSTLVQGQVLRVDVDVHLLKNTSSSVAVVSLLPGGFELVLDHKDDSSSSEDMSITREDDRVIVFVEAGRKAQRVTYHMRAVTQGTFALPAVQAEGLFDTTLQSHTVGGRVHVVAP